MLFNTLGYSLILVAMTGVLVIAIMLNRGLVFDLLSNRPMVFIGTISFTLHLVHKLVPAAAHSVITDRYFAVGLALVFSLAWASLSWFLMEKPVAQFKKSVAPLSGADAAYPTLVGPGLVGIFLMSGG